MSSGKNKLQELFDKAIDEDTALAAALRAGLMLAKTVNNEEMEDWIRLELEGYPRGSEIPGYRSLYGEIKVEMPGRGFVPVKLSRTEEHRSTKTGSPISELEDLARSEPSKIIGIPLPPELEMFIIESTQHPFPPSFVISRSSLVSVLDSVRTQLVEHLLKVDVNLVSMKTGKEASVPMTNTEATKKSLLQKYQDSWVALAVTVLLVAIPPAWYISYLVHAKPLEEKLEKKKATIEKLKRRKAEIGRANKRKTISGNTTKREAHSGNTTKVIPELVSGYFPLPNNRTSARITRSSSGYFVTVDKGSFERFSFAGGCWELHNDVPFAKNQCIEIRLHAVVPGWHQIKLERKKSGHGTWTKRMTFIEGQNVVRLSTAIPYKQLDGMFRRFCIVVDKMTDMSKTKFTLKSLQLVTGEFCKPK